MDFKNFGEKLFQSVRVRSFSFTTSDKPEVPARAAAAAAVAKGIIAIPEHERLPIASTSDETPSVYSARLRGVNAEPLEEEYFEKDFDPVRYLLEHLPETPNQEFFEAKVSQRMVQLDDITEKLSRHVMEHHEEMVRGMRMVTEIGKDLQVAKIICKNGRRRLSLAMGEVSQDLEVAANVKKKHILMDMLPTLEAINRAVDIKSHLDDVIGEGNYGEALQMCSECLHVLDTHPQLAAAQDMNVGIEEWLQKTIIKVDAVLLDVCYNFNAKNYMMVIDAYTMIDDVAAVSDKVQTFYAQVIVSKTYNVLMAYLSQNGEMQAVQKKGRMPYSDLCLRLPDVSYRPCLHKTLEVLFDVIQSFYQMIVCEWIPQPPAKLHDIDDDKAVEGSTSSVETVDPVTQGALEVAKGLEKGRKMVWELAARRVSALLSSNAICAYSPQQFLQSLDLLHRFILSGEAFSGSEAVHLRAKLVKQSENYFRVFHRQNLEVLRLMLEKEPWQRLPSGVLETVHLAGLTGNGAPVVSPKVRSSLLGDSNSENQDSLGFGIWYVKGNPFSQSKISSAKHDLLHNSKGIENGQSHITARDGDEDDEDLLADFIDEESQLPSRSYEKQTVADNEAITITTSSLNILRSLDKYARLMQVLEPISLEVLKGLCQVFEIYFFTVFKMFGQRDAFNSGRGQFEAPSVMSSRLRGALVRISQQLEEQRLKYANQNQPVFDNPSSVFGIKERTVAAESVMHLASVLRSAKPRLQSLLQQSALPVLEQFFVRSVDATVDLKNHIYKTISKLLLNVGGHVERIANARWELKELGMEHNGYVDLMLGEFKQYTSRLSNAGLSTPVQELLLQHGIDVLAEALVEGYSRVRRCTNEGRALMSLDLQVLINGLQRLTASKQRPNLQFVDVYIKAFYLPETEYLFWVKSHPEYSKSQVIGLINLVANMNNWKKKSRTDLLDKIETGEF